MTALPMPRDGTLTTRLKLTSSCGIDDQLEVREGVLDFLPLVEPDAADDAVRRAVAHQLVFERARLRVQPIENGHGRVATSRHLLAQFARDEGRLLEFVLATEVRDRGRPSLLGPEALLLAIGVVGITAEAASRMFCVER